MNTSLFSRGLATLGAIGVVLLSASASDAITRDEVMVRARSFANHPWRCEVKNLTASCSSAYQSMFTVGDQLGVPYDWGGYITLFDFDQEIESGAGAGSDWDDGELDCTVGVDCSGYVSKCWDSGHYGTSTIDAVTSVISQAQVLPGDVFNKAGYHVMMFSHKLANGDPVMYESAPPNVHINPYGGWANTSGYTPLRYDGITGATAGNPIGTLSNPIKISSLPYTDSRNTMNSSSDVLDGCAASPNTPESGPEYVYQVTFTQPGQLTVGVSDDSGVDIDVHLYGSASTNDCMARNDSTFTTSVDCGTYFIVADTYGSGLDNAGAYTLNVSFAPSSSACGSGPPSYDPVGGLGEPCGFPGHENLPMCNPNLDAFVCVYTSGTAPISFCTHPCSGIGDCGEFPGGCCNDLGTNEYYCMTSAFCGTAPPDAGPLPDAAPQTDAPVVDTGSTPDSAILPDATPNPDAPVQPDSAVFPDAAPMPDAHVGYDAPVPIDAGTDPSNPNGSAQDDDGGGCGCRTTGNSPRSPMGVIAAFAAAWLLGRRRRRS